MLSSVINSERAIEVNISIMRAFVKLWHYVLSKHDKAIEQIIIALNNLIEQPPKTRKIGFNTGN
jgi:hypothetical protein